MKFSTRTTYGLKAMILLAKNAPQNSISLANIANEGGISAKYLERLFALLKKNGLVVSEKGSAGGYRLSRKADKIAVFDIIKSVEGRLAPFHCFDDDGRVRCAAKCNCGVVEVLGRVQTAVYGTLKNIKLSELV